MLARIGAAIGKYDRGGVIGPPNRNENDGRGRGGHLHRSASFRVNPDKVQKRFDMACSRLPNTTFSWIYFSIWHVSLVCYDENVLRETGPIGQR